MCWSIGLLVPNILRSRGHGSALSSRCHVAPSCSALTPNFPAPVKQPHPRAGSRRSLSQRSSLGRPWLSHAPTKCPSSASSKASSLTLALEQLRA